MRFAIGIDPDVDKSGFASWDIDRTEFTAIENYSFFDLLDILTMLKKYIQVVRIEAGWLNKKSNFHPAQGPRMREKIAKNVLPYFFNQFVERYVIGFTRGHFNDFPFLNQRNELINQNADFFRIVTERFHSGENVGISGRMIRTENIHNQIVTAFKLCNMISNVGQSVSRLSG